MFLQKLEDSTTHSNPEILNFFQQSVLVLSITYVLYSVILECILVAQFTCWNK